MTRIILFGDDILGGVREWRVSDRFTNLVKQKFPRAQVINHSIPGHKTSHALTHVHRDVADLHPDLVVLSFGLNDISTTNEMKPGYFTHNLVEIIECIGPEKIVLISPPFCDYRKQRTRSWARQLQFTLAAEYTAKQFNIPFVNMLKKMQANRNPQRYLLDDGVRFSDEGYNLLLREVAPAMQKVLDRQAVHI